MIPPCRMLLAALAALAVGGLMTAGSGAQAQNIVTCPTQQELEQVRGSQGRFIPDGCRRLAITPVQTATGRLCVLNFKPGSDPGIFDRLVDATVPTQWWVACEDLAPRS